MTFHIIIVTFPYLPFPHPVFEVLSKTGEMDDDDDDDGDDDDEDEDDKPVDDDGDGQCEDKDRKQGSKASNELQLGFCNHSNYMTLAHGGMNIILLVWFFFFTFLSFRLVDFDFFDFLWSFGLDDEDDDDDDDDDYDDDSNDDDDDDVRPGQHHFLASSPRTQLWSAPSARTWWQIILEGLQNVKKNYTEKARNSAFTPIESAYFFCFSQIFTRIHPQYL